MSRKEIIDILTKGTTWNLQNQNLKLRDVEYLSSLLKKSKALYLYLSHNNLEADSVNSLSRNLLTTKLIQLCLSNNSIGSLGVRYLVNVLKHTQIKFLDLSYNNIGDEGCEYLSHGLEDSRIERLYLTSNHITDEGVAYLVMGLKGAPIARFDLSDNKISIKSAELFNRFLEYKIVKENILLDIFDTTGTTKLISQDISQISKVKIHHIDANLGKYINKNFKRIHTLNFDVDYLEGSEVENFYEAFKGITIHELILRKKHVTPKAVEHLIKIFAKSRIINLSLRNEKIGAHGMTTLLEFLKSIDPIDLDLYANEIHDEGVCCLIPYLKSSNIRRLELGNNHICNNGFKKLAEILKYTKLVKLGLSYNIMKPDAAFNMAQGLIGSSITYLDLHNSHIEDTGAAYFQSVFKKTQIACADLTANRLGVTVNRYTADVKNNKMLADRICSHFDKIITLNRDNISLEFAINDYTSIDHYIELIKILNNNPIVKAHIICRNIKFANEIDELCEKFCEKFNMFINNNIPLLETFFENFHLVNFIKKFEQANLSNIVQNLLVHSSLFYVNEDNKILHPFVYKMLHKYDMPLCNENLNPNRRLEIINYFEQHPEIEESKEAIELLQST